MVPLLIFMEPLARLLGAEGEIVHLCVVYGSIWLAVDAADLCCLALGITLILSYRKRYGY